MFLVYRHNAGILSSFFELKFFRNVSLQVQKKFGCCLKGVALFLNPHQLILVGVNHGASDKFKTSIVTLIKTLI